MSGYIKVIAVGRATKDLELKYYDDRKNPNSKRAACYFDIAVPKDYKESDGTQKVDFIKVKTSGVIAENAANYIRKGKLILVEGKPTSEAYQTKDGNIISKTCIVAKNIQYLEFTKDEIKSEAASNQVTDSEVSGSEMFRGNFNYDDAPFG